MPSSWLWESSSFFNFQWTLELLVFQHPTSHEGLDLGRWTGWSLYRTTHLSALSGAQQTGQPLAILSSLAQGWVWWGNWMNLRGNRINPISILKLMIHDWLPTMSLKNILVPDWRQNLSWWLLVLPNAKSRCAQTKRSWTTFQTAKLTLALWLLQYICYIYVCM